MSFCPTGTQLCHWRPSLGRLWETLSTQSPVSRTPGHWTGEGPTHLHRESTAQAASSPPWACFLSTPRPTWLRWAPDRSGLTGSSYNSLWPGPAFHPPGSLFRSTSAQPGPTPCPSVGLAGELAYGPGLALHLLHRSPNRSPLHVLLEAVTPPPSLR